jgi:hypothetical protein
MQARIFDLTKCARRALQNAASTAGSLLTENKDISLFASRARGGECGHRVATNAAPPDAFIQPELMDPSSAISSLTVATVKELF